MLFVQVRPAEGVIVGVSADNGDGTYTYTYTVDNSGGSFDIVGFSLGLDLPSGEIDWNQDDIFIGGGVAVPNADWFAQPGFPISTASAQDFFSLAAAGDVLIGTTLSGFSFISGLTPGTIAYFEFGAAGESALGTTTGPTLPTAIPETGGSAVMLSMSLGLLVGARRWFRR